MKKLLLATTCFGMLAAGTASATAPTIKLGGYADFQTGVADQEIGFENAANRANGEPGANPLNGEINTSADTLLFIDVEADTDFGLTYGAHITLEADVSGSDNRRGNEAHDKTFIFAETAYGRAEVGATTSPAYAMQVGAESLARATGGIAGDFIRYIDLDGNNNGVGSRSFYSAPGLYNDAQPRDVDALIIGQRRTANKYALYTPVFHGFQFGGSFTPDTAERGSVRGFTGNTEAVLGGIDTHFKNVFDFGGKYENQFNGLGIQASATGQIGEAKNTLTIANRDDLSSYNFGLLASFAGVSLAGSYGFADEIGRSAGFNSETEYFTAGGSYEYGPFGASVTYLDSTVENDASVGGNNVDSEFQNIVVGADYKLAPGFVPYVEVSFYESDDNNAATQDNEGTVFLSGIALTF